MYLHFIIVYWNGSHLGLVKLDKNELRLLFIDWFISLCFYSEADYFWEVRCVIFGLNLDLNIWLKISNVYGNCCLLWKRFTFFKFHNQLLIVWIFLKSIISTLWGTSSSNNVFRLYKFVEGKIKFGEFKKEIFVICALILLLPCYFTLN